MVVVGDPAKVVNYKAEPAVLCRRTGPSFFACYFVAAATIYLLC